MAERLKLVCTSCSYKFTRESETKMTLKCPYCGDKSVHPYKPLNADYFLKSV